MENKMCEVDGCNTGARFGSEADDLVRFCKAHSRDGDVNLQRLQCVEPGYDGRRPPRSFSFGTATAADGVARGAVMQGAPRGGEKFTSRMTLRAMVRAQMRQADCKEHSRRGARLRLRQLTLTPLSFESFSLW
jgi:hypothetical protein